MRRNVLLAIGLAAILAGAGATVIWSQIQMKTLGVVLYVTDETIAKGAIVSILVRKVPAEQFDARYPVDPDAAPVPGAPEAARQWHATLTGPVNLVYFEVPDDVDYTYRFRAVPVNDVAEARVQEKVIGNAGRNVDADGNELNLDEFGLTRVHMIEGDLIGAALVDRSPDGREYDFGPQDCVEGDHVRVCVPSDAELRRRADYLAKSSGPGPQHPWER